MKTLEMPAAFKKLAANKFVLAVLLLGLVLILLPERSSSTAPDTGHTADTLEATGVSLETEGEKLADLLTQIEGVGQCQVLLSKSGAVIVCRGAELATVRLNVTNAVMSYTGLGSDKITVMKMK